MKTIKNIILASVLLLPTFFVGFYVYAYSSYFSLTPRAEKDKLEILPDETFTISFPKQINKEYYRGKIGLIPATNANIFINETGTKITFTPHSTWKPGEHYNISLPEGRTNSLARINAASFSFSVVDYPKVIEVFPSDGARDVLLDIEDPISVKLDKSAIGFYIDFSLEPSVPLKFQINEKRNQFSILPLEKLEEGVKYKLNIKIKPNKAEDKDYVSLSETSFITLPPPPKDWSKNLEERLIQARKFTQPRIKKGKYIDINLSAQVMTIFENGLLLNSFLISSGKRGMDTPKGEYKICNKYPRSWSKQYGLFMPYWMAIVPSGKYGIHELPEWPGGYKEGANHLGIPVSHGCVRLGVGAAQTVYEWADIGTPVIAY